MVSVRNRMIATSLSVILATSPLLGCGKVAQTKNVDPKKQDDMVKDGEQDQQGKTVPYNKKGEYTVTLQEADFTKGEDENQASDAEAENKNDASNTDEKASAEQDKTANDDTQAKLDEAKAELEKAKEARDNEQTALDQAKEAEEQAKRDAEATPQNTEAVTLDTDAEAQNADDAEQKQKSEAFEKATEAREQAEANLAKAEEEVATAELKVQELEATISQASAEKQAEKDLAEAEKKQDEKKALTFGDVKLENVKVYYDALTNREEFEADKTGEVEPQHEEREAEVKALSNDNGAITLSFVDPDAATNATNGYCVVIDGLKLYAPISVDMEQPTLSTDSRITADSDSADITIKAQDGNFASDLSASDLKLSGSFRKMTVTGAEASGDTLTVHLSGKPMINHKVSSVYMDGQIIVPATGFDSATTSATAYVPVDLPEKAFDLGKAEALAPATAIGDVDYSSVDGDTGKATVYLHADLGSFNDIKPENITLEDAFEGGKVESVSKEGEDNDLLKVEVSFPTKDVDENDYNLAGTLKLSAGAMTDENGEAAPEVESTVAVNSGEDMGKAEGDNKGKDDKKKKDTTDETLAAAGTGLKYTQKWVKKVDPTLAKLTGFCGECFNIAANIYSGKWSKALESGFGLLKLVGITPDEKEVTAEDVLKEVKGLRTVVNSIDTKVSDIAKENRQDLYTQTSIRLKKLQDACTSAEAMFQEGAKLLATRKDNPMQAPGENASDEEIVKYNAELRALMLKEQEQERLGNRTTSMFSDLDNTMQKMRETLTEVTGWVSIRKGAFNEGVNSIDVYDKLVSGRFNWDTQGYYARAAFRGELKYTISTAWAAISTFYNATDPKVKNKYVPDFTGVVNALEQVDARPAGTSPNEIRELNQAGKDFKLYSPSLGYSIKRSRLVNGGLEASEKSDEATGNDKINEYKRRLQGSLYEDLQLAGLEKGDENTKFDGIGFRHNIQWHYHRHLGRHRWLAGSGYYNVEAWTLMMFQDKSASAKKTFKGTQDAGKKQTIKGDKWYTFYWFDRA